MDGKITHDARGGAGAFTLIELLVVIDDRHSGRPVVAGPGAGQGAAVRIHCVNNLKQLGLAMRMYGDDYNAWLPMPHGSVPWGATNPPPWSEPLAAYYHNTNILRCAALSQLFNKSPYNYFMGARAAYVAAGDVAGVCLKNTQRPSQYILSGDCNYPFDTTDADPDNTRKTRSSRRPICRAGRTRAG